VDEWITSLSMSPTARAIVALYIVLPDRRLCVCVCHDAHACGTGRSPSTDKHGVECPLYGDLTTMEVKCAAKARDDEGYSTR
jgi:hypothetical protein